VNQWKKIPPSLGVISKVTWRATADRFADDFLNTSHFTCWITFFVAITLTEQIYICHLKKLVYTFRKNPKTTILTQNT